MEQVNQPKFLTPRDIFKGLNDYVIGQNNVKVALSVGVHNHYKRIMVAEAQQQNAALDPSSNFVQQPSSSSSISSNSGGVSNINHPSSSSIALSPSWMGSTTLYTPTPTSMTTTTTVGSVQQQQQQPSTSLSSSTPNPFTALNMTQFGRANISSSTSTENGKNDNPTLEEMNKNNIAYPQEIGRFVEDCELDKSNIIIVGPTGRFILFFGYLRVCFITFFFFSRHSHTFYIVLYCTIP